MAVQLAKSIDIRGSSSPILRGLLPAGNAQVLVDVLVDQDEALWQELEHQVATSLDQSLSPRQQADLVKFFQSPLGKAWQNAERALINQTAEELETSQTTDAPILERLKQALRLDDAAAAEILGRNLSKRQIKKLTKFFESALGQAWLDSSEKSAEQLFDSFQQPSAMRRLGTIGCSIGILAPNLDAVLQNPDEVLTRDQLEPLMPRIEIIQNLCDCLMGKLVEILGPEALSMAQQDDPKVMETIQYLIQEGDCIPDEILQAAEASVGRQTAQTMRNIGVAMMDWLTRRLVGEEDSEPDRLTDAGWTVQADGGNTAVFVQVTADELERILVPDYMKEMPRLDGWDRPLQFAVNYNLIEEQTLSIRSAGPDGVFEDAPYAVSGFSELSEGSSDDMVWVDGYLILAPSPEP